MKPARSIGAVGAKEMQSFEQLLSTFLAETQARCALIVDRSGRLLTAAGDTGGFDHTTFASLAAADFAASDQLATLLGEDEFAALYHHGPLHSMYLADLAGWAILAALFDGRATLGMIRLQTRHVVPRFDQLFSALAEQGPAGGASQIEVGWAAEAENEIDRLFTD